jgi:hypothetical protein
MGMISPVSSSRRSYTLPRLDAREAEALATRLRGLQGVRDARIVTSENTAYLEVDSTRFDEHNALQLITGET